MKCKTLKGKTCAQVYSDGKGYIRTDPMTSKKEAGITLGRFLEDVGVPNKMIYDGAPEQIGPESKFQKIMRKYQIKGHQNEAFTQKNNRAEDGVRELKRRWKQRLIRRRAPKRVWDFGLVWESEILSRMCRNNSTCSGIERITGDTPDISEWLEFEFYDICWYWDTPNDIDNPKIGRWLGVSHRVGSAMCYWILTSMGTIISRTTVQHITKEETMNDDIMDEIRLFHTELDNNIGQDQYVHNDHEFSSYINEDVPDPGCNDLYPQRFTEEPYQGYDIPDIDEIGKSEDEYKSADVYDKYIGAEVLMPGPGGDDQMAKVVKRLKTNENKQDGKYYPILDTSEYLIEFNDGTTKEITANIIAESMFSGVDSEGRHYQLLNEITDHVKDSTAIEQKDGYIKSKNGNQSPKMTTRGWKLLVEWKDSSSSWIPLKDLKVSNPVELAEYAIANGLSEEPAFKWWVNHTIKKRDIIISKVKSKYWRTTHKFGIRIPKDVNEAIQLDDENKNRRWYNSIQKEVSNVRIAFDAKPEISVDDARSNKALVGYQEIRCHMIFDIKMDGKFTRKARFVAGGHTTDPPSSITYSSVVARDSVRIAFTIAALNGLDCMACDIGNAYLNAPCREKIWCIAGREFGSEKGTVMVITRALYGLKSSGASWRAMFATTLADLGYVPTKADPDVWLRPKIKKNGDDYYSMILVYVDDVLCFDESPQELMDKLGKIYRLKEGSQIPDRYLGANIDRVQLSNGDIQWSMSSQDYVGNAIITLEEALEKENCIPLRSYGKKSGERPFPVNYKPEIDISPELGDELTIRYMQLIGTLRWAIELGRIDIMAEVSLLSQYQCSPREGHLDAVYRIFWYLKCCLKKKQLGRIVFDPSVPYIDEQIFNSNEEGAWRDFYPDAEEMKPLNAPEPRGRSMTSSCYVDADHAGNLMTRRSHTGIFIYLNNTPVIFYSKRQNTVESSSFGSEFIALRIATEMIESLRYKLRMFGVNVEGPTSIFCDNKSVVTNSSIPTSMLNKKHNSICYHKVRETHAEGATRVGWILGEYNKSDLLTKTSLSTKRRYDLSNSVFDNECLVIESKKSR